MNSTENQADLLQGKSPAGSSAAVDAVQAQVKVLRRILCLSLMGLILLSFGVNLFIWRQTTLLRGGLQVNKQAITEFFRTEEPVIRDFLGRLQGFASANPDFQPILGRYVNQPRATPAPTGAPARAPTSVAPPGK